MKHESWLMAMAIAIVLFLTSIFIVRTCYRPKGTEITMEQLFGTADGTTVVGSETANE